MQLPDVSSDRLVKFFLTCGYVKKSQTKLNITMKKEGANRRLFIPANKEELSSDIVLSLLKEAGISPDDFIHAI